MSLNDTVIRSLKPKATAYKVADERGLFLLVTPAGGKLWKLKFRNGVGVEKKLALGAYPELRLKDAREARDEARSALAKGVDPAERKQSDKRAAKVNAANTFGVIARAYIEKNRQDGKAEATVNKREWFLGLVDRAIGHRPIADIQPYEILEAVRPYEAAKNHEKSHRTLQFVGQVFRFAVANQIAPRDPTRDLRGALTKRQPKHHAAILEPKLVGDLLRAVDGYEGQGIPVTRIALQLSPHVFVRPGELRSAEWKEVDLEGAVWRIPATRMKGRQEHVVPLSRQVIALFREARMMTGSGRYIFPSIRTHLKPMSENTVNAALRRLGFSNDEMTAHGFAKRRHGAGNRASRQSVEGHRRKPPPRHLPRCISVDVDTAAQRDELVGRAKPDTDDPPAVLLSAPDAQAEAGQDSIPQNSARGGDRMPPPRDISV